MCWRRVFCRGGRGSSASESEVETGGLVRWRRNFQKALCERLNTVEVVLMVHRESAEARVHR